MTEPSIDMAEVAEEMTRDPLSRALFENAQLRVLTRQQARRIADLEAQKATTEGSGGA